MHKTHLTEQEIDEIIIAQAEDESGWEPAIDVQIEATTSLSIPPQLARKAAFFAQLHNKTSMQAWLEAIIQERIEFETAAFASLQQALSKTS